VGPIAAASNELYPRDWSQSKLDTKSQIKLKKSKFNFIGRIKPMNHRLCMTGVEAESTQNQYKHAVDELAKA